MDKIQLQNLGLDTFIAVDVETTGLDYNKDKIIEISAVKFKDGKENSTFSKLVNPNINISPFITNLTGISNSMIDSKETFHEIADEFMGFIKDCPIIGHNVKFDIDFINNELENYKIKQDYVCDTYYLTKIFFYYLSSFKLESISSSLNINIERAHRALDDAKSSGLLFLKLLDKMLTADINSLYMLNKTSKTLNSELFSKILNFKLQDSNIYSLNKNHFSSEVEKNKNNISHEIKDILGKEGLFAKNNNKYEYRESQISFSKHCLKTIENNDILVAEAGTGLGKSLGYLVPALINIDKSNIIISTSTHTLQNQLIEKDIPIVSEVLNKKIKALIIKGKNNYLCFERLSNLIDNIEDSLILEEEYYELQSLLVWANKTLTGDIGECESFNVKRNRNIWNFIKYSNEYCYIHSNKKQFKCFYNKVLRKSKDSNVFIINHALLASNIDNQDFLFKKSSICIIDEAHKLIDNFRNSLMSTFSYLDIQREYESSILLINNLLKENNETNLILNNFKIFRKKMNELIHAFKKFSFNYANSKINKKNLTKGQQVIDIRYSISKDEEYFVSFSAQHIIDLLKESINLFVDMKKTLSLTNVSNMKKIEMSNILKRLKNIEDSIQNNFFRDRKNTVLWLKVYCDFSEVKFCVFNSSPLSVVSMMKKFISNSNSLIFCSATLSINGDFSYFLKDSGLDKVLTDKNLQLENFESPFYYNDQIKLFFYDSNEDINSDIFIKKISQLIMDIKNRVNKRMLILCTSFKQIEAFKFIFNKNKIDNILFQNSSSSKERLLKQYIGNNKSILFGTNSFWEGVDLPEDLLELLIILKVPFSNPHNPIISAKIDIYNDEGLNPFYQYQIPQAILKLKQGIGRLIRSQNDSGVCIITDTRLMNKKYGQIIRDSLPIMGDVTSENSLIVNKTETFLNI